MRNLKLFFENLPSKASSLQINCCIHVTAFQIPISNPYYFSLALKIFIPVLVIAWGNKGRVKRRFHISPVLWRPPMGSQPSLMLDHIMFTYSGIRNLISLDFTINTIHTLIYSFNKDGNTCYAYNDCSHLCPLTYKLQYTPSLEVWRGNV